MNKCAHFQIDLTDSFQPLALLKVNQTLRQMQAGDGLEIRGSDPETFQALMRLVPDARFQVTAAELKPKTYHIRLTRKPTHETDSDIAIDPSSTTKGDQDDNGSEHHSG